MSKKFLGSAKVTSRGQVVIPKEVRERFKIKKGNFILFYKENGKLTIQKG